MYKVRLGRITHKPGASSKRTFRLFNISVMISSSQRVLMSSRHEAITSTMSSSESFTFRVVDGPACAAPFSGRALEGAVRSVRNLSRAVFQPLEELIENSCRPRRPEDDGWSNGAAVLTDVECGSILAEPILISSISWTLDNGPRRILRILCLSVNLRRGRALGGRGAKRSSCDSSGWKGRSDISLVRCARMSLTLRTRLRKMTARQAAFSSYHSRRA